MTLPPTVRWAGHMVPQVHWHPSAHFSKFWCEGGAQGRCRRPASPRAICTFESIIYKLSSRRRKWCSLSQNTVLTKRCVDP
jgi:hypothetical protein